MLISFLYARPCRVEKECHGSCGISNLGRSSFVLKILATEIEVHANCFSPHAVHSLVIVKNKQKPTEKMEVKQDERRRRLA